MPVRVVCSRVDGRAAGAADLCKRRDYGGAWKNWLRHEGGFLGTTCTATGVAGQREMDCRHAVLCAHDTRTAHCVHGISQSECVPLPHYFVSLVSHFVYYGIWMHHLPPSFLLLLLLGGVEGWLPDPELWRFARQLKPRCTLARGRSEDVRLADVTEPLLVPLSDGSWPAHWEDRDAFVERYGGVSVEPRGALVTAQGGATRRQHQHHRHQHGSRPLRQVLDGWRNVGSNRSAQHDGRVVFEAAGRDWRGGADIRAEEPPTCAAGGECDASEGKGGWWSAMRGELEALVLQHDADPVLSIAPSRHGLSRHTHGAAWLALLASGGGKWWLLNPPTVAGTAWAAERRSTLQWLQLLGAEPGSDGSEQRHGASLPDGVQWCLQLPGEAMLLPAYWHHQTLNLGESVAVGGQHNNLRWQDPVEAVRQLRAQQSMNVAPNPRLLEALSDAMLHTSKEAAGRGGKETGAAAKASLRYLLEAVAVEPLNGRLALRAARQAHALGRQRLVVQLLRDAVTTLAELEAADGVGAADAAERGGQLGVALATLAKEESTTALPLLQRAVAQLDEDANVVPNPESVELVYTLAYAHGRGGQRTKAMRLLRRVLRMEPGHADARKILGVMEKRGKS